MNVLSFGLTSPRIFTKIMKPVISHLRSKNIKISAYLDDIFVGTQSEDIPTGMKNEMTAYYMKSHVNIVINLNNPGSDISFEKSSSNLPVPWYIYS